tara:strand:+ start:1328 stop:2974 length:1647 start_codon:yes stop_codon:yes gene_type:complete
MAINYLNSIDLNKNEILQGVIENQPNDAAAGASPVEGQLYFNTTNHVLMQYNGSSWEEAGGGVETLTTTDGTYIDLTPNSATAGAVTVTADLSAVDGTAVAATRFLSKDNTWDVPAFDNYSGWTLDADGAGATAFIGPGATADFVGGLKIGTNSTSGGTLNITHDLQTQTDSTSAASPAAGATFTVVDSVTRDTTGHATGLNVKTITLPTDTNTQETYTLPVSAGTAVAGYTVADIDLTAAGASTGIKSKVTFAGKNSNIAITETTGNNGIVNIALTPAVTIDDNLTVGGEINQTSTGNENTFASELNMSSLNITNLLDPTSPQDAATKQYVDDATVGGLVYQGAYNASTNTPDLDSASSIAVEKGWTYTVTVAGLFFTEQVRVGDVLIAEVDQAAGASTLANWTTVQNNIDLASSTQVGIGNVVAGGAIDVSYTSGTATVSVENASPTNKGAISVLAGTGISVNYSSGVATVANTDTNTTNTATGTIAAGQLSGTVTHAFGINTIVQTIDASGNTVFCDITRTTTTSVATISAVEATAITILVQKIG